MLTHIFLGPAKHPVFSGGSRWLSLLNRSLFLSPINQNSFLLFIKGAATTKLYSVLSVPGKGHKKDL